MEVKFILFIVEGYNDKKELEAILHSKLFDKYRDKYRPEFYVTNGDITTSAKISVSNVRQRLNDILQDFKRKGVPYSNIKNSEIQEIVQVTDLDGAYIPFENIIQSDDCKFKYTDENILTSNVDGAIGRNKKKADIIYELAQTPQIGGIPYSIYYVSCNMDHVLFDDRNPSQQSKNSKSDEFRALCAENENLAYESIFNADVAVPGDYYDSWEYIFEECNSLKRHTNLNLFFSEDAKNEK